MEYGLKKHDLQVIQNDVLRFSKNNKREDRVMLKEMHNKARLVSLEQRWCKQLLSLNEVNQNNGARNTRQYVFHIDAKIGTKNSHSSYHIGINLWEKLNHNIQFSVIMFSIRTSIYNQIPDNVLLNQVEATTEKRPMVIRGNRLFSRVAKCTGTTARPELCTIL